MAIAFCFISRIDSEEAPPVAGIGLETLKLLLMVFTRLASAGRYSTASSNSTLLIDVISSTFALDSIPPPITYLTVNVVLNGEEPYELDLTKLVGSSVRLYRDTFENPTPSSSELGTKISSSRLSVDEPN